MTNITINNSNFTIVLTKKYEKAASRFGTPEYRELQEARRDYPNYKVVTKAVSRSKSGNKKPTFVGLNYSRMEEYIREHDEDGTIYKKYEDHRGLSKKAKKMCSKPKNYAEIKRWFLDTYPEFEEFQNELNKPISKKTTSDEKTSIEFKNNIA